MRAARDRADGTDLEGGHVLHGADVVQLDRLVPGAREQPIAVLVPRYLCACHQDRGRGRELSAAVESMLSLELSSKIIDCSGKSNGAPSDPFDAT